VFVVIGHKIVQREAVVTGNKSYALTGGPIPGTVEVPASCDSLAKFGGRICVSLYKTANIISKLAIPLLPLIGAEAADLV
jgi:hypothetical protein